jgi:TfoX/Sxy family transcriptional regulator of competence genes
MKRDNSFVNFVMDQIHGAGEVSCRAMFGGYAVYCRAKVVALICDDRLFIKPTARGRELIGSVSEALPYPGAKPWFLIEDQIENSEWLCELIRATADELPMPKPKKLRMKKRQNHDTQD